MPEMKTLNGYEIVDAKAREDISKINIPDLGDYAKKSDIPTVPTKTSQLTNDSGYITSSSIPTKVSQLTNDSGYIKSIPSEYVTETELTNKGYLTSDNFVVLTKTAYNNLSTKDSNTFYFIKES